MEFSPPASSVHGILQARILGQVAISSSGIFLTQGSNLCLPHWQVDFLPLSHQRNSQLPFSFCLQNSQLLPELISFLDHLHRANSSESTFLTSHFPVMPHGANHDGVYPPSFCRWPICQMFCHVDCQPPTCCFLTLYCSTAQQVKISHALDIWCRCSHQGTPLRQWLSIPGSLHPEVLPVPTCGSRFGTGEEENESSVWNILQTSLEMSSIRAAYLPPAGTSFRAPLAHMELVNGILLGAQEDK